MGRKSKFEASFKMKEVLEALKEKETLSALAKKYSIAPKQVIDRGKVFMEKTEVLVCFVIELVCYLQTNR